MMLAQVKSVLFAIHYTLDRKNYNLLEFIRNFRFSFIIFFNWFATKTKLTSNFINILIVLTN